MKSPNRRTFIQQTAAAIASLFRAVDDAVVTRRRDANAVGAHLARTIRRNVARIIGLTGLAHATAVDARLTFVDRAVVAASRLAETLDALPLDAIGIFYTPLPELACLAVGAAAVDVGLAEVRIGDVVGAVLGFRLGDELVVVRAGCRHGDAQTCEKKAAQPTGSQEMANIPRPRQIAGRPPGLEPVPT